MSRAYVAFKDTPHYRMASFMDGLARLGYSVSKGLPEYMNQGDVLVTWNRMAQAERAVNLAQQVGAAHIVAENGFYGQDAEGVQAYAMALDQHNGAGRWFVGDDSRLKALQIEFQPWRAPTGGAFLVADQRGIGSPLMRSPPDFAHRAQSIIRAQGREAFVRLHPGRHQPVTSLAQDLEDKDALVVWSSNAATQALIAGVPVHFMAPHIVTQGAAKRLTTSFLWNNGVDKRPEAFKRMSWAQWFLPEIASGEAFRVLLDVHLGRLPPH